MTENSSSFVFTKNLYHEITALPGAQEFHIREPVGLYDGHDDRPGVFGLGTG
jgi:hypothetical protein